MRGRQVDTGLEHCLEVLCVLVGVGFCCGGIVGYRVRIEKESERRAYVVDGMSYAGFLKGVADLAAELFGKAIQTGVGILRFEKLQCSDAGGDTDGISGKCSGLIDAAVWREIIHKFCFSTTSAYGKATSDYFAEAGQVGFYVEELLDAAVCEPESGYDFVED